MATAPARDSSRTMRRSTGSAAREPALEGGRELLANQLDGPLDDVIVVEQPLRGRAIRARGTSGEPAIRGIEGLLRAAQPIGEVRALAGGSRSCAGRQPPDAFASVAVAHHENRSGGTPRPQCPGRLRAASSAGVGSRPNPRSWSTMIGRLLSSSSRAATLPYRSRASPVP